jgi:hypothetical protein
LTARTSDNADIECGMQELRHQAIRFLPAMAVEGLPDGPNHCFWFK